MENKLVRELKKFEGRSVEDFLYSDLCEMLDIDIYKVNGKEIGCGEEYQPDHRAIRFIEIRNVIGYMILDITTEA